MSEISLNGTLVVAPTPYGRGVFAHKAFRPGDLILCFKGPVVAEELLPEPYHAVSDLYLQIGERLFLGPSGEVDDYVNHSCNPSAGIREVGDEFWLVAIKPIGPNDEVTFDYSTTMDDDGWQMSCRCGSSECRTVIRDYKRLPANIQQKYLELGIIPRFLSS